MASFVPSERPVMIPPIRTTIAIIFTPALVSRNECYLTMQPAIAPVITRATVYAWLNNPSTPRNYAKLVIQVAKDSPAFNNVAMIDNIAYVVNAITKSAATFTHMVLDHSAGLHTINTPFFRLLRIIPTITRIHIITGNSGAHANIWDWPFITTSFPNTNIRVVQYSSLSSDDDYRMLYHLTAVSVTHLICGVDATNPDEFAPVRPMPSIKCATFSVNCIHPRVPTTIAADTVITSIQRVLDMCPALTSLRVSTFAMALDDVSVHHGTLATAIVDGFHRIRHATLVSVWCDPRYAPFFKNKRRFPCVTYVQHIDTPLEPPPPPCTAVKFCSATSHMDRPRENPVGPLLTAFFLALERLTALSISADATAEAAGPEAADAAPEAAAAPPPENYLPHFDPSALVDALTHMEFPGPENDDESSFYGSFPSP